MADPIGQLTTSTSYSAAAAPAGTPTRPDARASTSSASRPARPSPSRPAKDALAGSYTFTHNYTTNIGLPDHDIYPASGSLPAETVLHGYSTALDVPNDPRQPVHVHLRTPPGTRSARSPRPSSAATAAHAYITNTYDTHTGALTDSAARQHRGIGHPDRRHQLHLRPGRQPHQPDRDPPGQRRRDPVLRLRHPGPAHPGLDRHRRLRRRPGHQQRRHRRLGHHQRRLLDQLEPRPARRAQDPDRTQPVRHPATPSPATPTTATAPASHTPSPRPPPPARRHLHLHLLLRHGRQHRPAHHPRPRTADPHLGRRRPTHRRHRQLQRIQLHLRRRRQPAAAERTPAPPPCTCPANNSPSTPASGQITGTRFYSLPGGGEAVRTGTGTPTASRLGDQHGTATLNLDSTSPPRPGASKPPTAHPAATRPDLLAGQPRLPEQTPRHHHRPHRRRRPLVRPRHRHLRLPRPALRSHRPPTTQRLQLRRLQPHHRQRPHRRDDHLRRRLP